MKQQQQCEDYSFMQISASQNWYMSQTLSHQRQNMWPTNCKLKDAHASVFFLYTSGTPHTRHICACFGLWGRPVCLSLLASFFWCYYERNLIHIALLSHFVFYPARDGCWIHINVGCSACIYSMPLVVSLNHRRQQSAGSAFQFHYAFPFLRSIDVWRMSLRQIIN